MKLINKYQTGKNITLTNGNQVPLYNLQGSKSLGLGLWSKDGNTYVNTDNQDPTMAGTIIYTAKDKEGNPVRDTNNKLITGKTLEEAQLNFHNALNNNSRLRYKYMTPSKGIGTSDMETLNTITGGVLNWTAPSLLIGFGTDLMFNNTSFPNAVTRLITGNSGVTSEQFASRHPKTSFAINFGTDVVSGLGYGVMRNNRLRTKTIKNILLRNAEGVDFSKNRMIYDPLYTDTGSRGYYSEKSKQIFINPYKALKVFFKNPKRFHSYLSGLKAHELGHAMLDLINTKKKNTFITNLKASVYDNDSGETMDKFLLKYDPDKWVSYPESSFPKQLKVHKGFWEYPDIETPDDFYKEMLLRYQDRLVPDIEYNDYYTANPKLYTKFLPLQRNKDYGYLWESSPDEFHSELINYSLTTPNGPGKKEAILNKLKNRFVFDEIEEADEVLKDLKPFYPTDFKITNDEWKLLNNYQKIPYTPTYMPGGVYKDRNK